MKDIMLWIAILMTGVVWAEDWTPQPYKGLETDYGTPLGIGLEVHTGDVQGYSYGVTEGFRFHQIEIGRQEYQGYSVGGEYGISTTILEPVR